MDKFLRLVVVTSTLLGAFAAQAIEFSSKVESDPVTVDIVGCVSEGMYKKCYDRAATLRMEVANSSYGTFYSYRNKNGTIVAEMNAVTGNQSENFFLYLRNVTPSCPLTIKLDRKDLKIMSMHLGCDPLAQAPTTENAG